MLHRLYIQTVFGLTLLATPSWATHHFLRCGDTRNRIASLIGSQGPVTEQVLVDRFIAATGAKAYSATYPVKGSDGGTKTLQFIEPDLGARVSGAEKTAAALEQFRAGLGKETMGLGFVKGYFRGTEGQAPFHAYVRIGDEMIHLDYVRESGREEEGIVHVENYTNRMQALAHDPFGMVTFESLYHLTPKEQEALKKFYLDLKHQEAEVDGEKPGLKYTVRGCGDFQKGAPLSIHCVVYALAFTNPQWWPKYPELRAITEKMGLGVATDESHQISIASVPKTVPASTSNALLVWGTDKSILAFNDPAAEYILGMRQLRARGVNSLDELLQKFNIDLRPGITIPTRE